MICYSLTKLIVAKNVAAQQSYLYSKCCIECPIDSYILSTRHIMIRLFITPLYHHPEYAELITSTLSEVVPSEYMETHTQSLTELDRIDFD